MIDKIKSFDLKGDNEILSKKILDEKFREKLGSTNVKEELLNIILE